MSTFANITYTNWRGETKAYRIRPIQGSFRFDDMPPYHPVRGWLIDAIDLDRNVERTFALKGLHSWEPVS